MAMASDTEECPSYIQTLSEFAYSDTKFTWKVGCPAEDEKGLLCSQFVPVKSVSGDFEFQISLEIGEFLIMALNYKSNFDSRPRVYFNHPLRVQVIIFDDKQKVVEEYIVTSLPKAPPTTYPKRIVRVVDWTLPQMTKKIKTQKTRCFTLNFCIQILEHPEDTMAKKVETGATHKETEANCLRALSEDLYDQFLDQNMVDVTLKCQDRNIKAHRFILMSRWPAIVDKMTSDSSVIDIADTRAEIVEQILEFIYSGNCVDTDEANIWELLSVADKNGLEDLCEHLCNDQLSQKVSTANVLELFFLSQKHEASRLEEEALALIRQYPSLIEMTTSNIVIASKYSNLWRKVYDERKPIDYVFPAEQTDNVEFTWEIDCSGFFANHSSISSKRFPVRINGKMHNCYITITKEGDKFTLLLNIIGFDDQMGTPFIKIYTIISTGRGCMDFAVKDKNLITNTCEIFSTWRLPERKKEQNTDLKCVTIYCSFYTQRFGEHKPVHQIPETVGIDIYRCLQNKSGVDVKLIAKGEEFEAHKLILSARSSVFAAMFQSGLTEQLTNTVHISDIDGKVLNQLLKFIYTATTDDNPDWTITAQLLFAAEKYDLQGLKALCELQLREKVTADNALEMLTLAHQHNAIELMKKSHRVLIQNTLRNKLSTCVIC